MKVKFFFRNSIICGLMVLGIVTCRPQPQKDGVNSDMELIFGSGGGFSGQVIAYTLLGNGELYMQNSLTKERKLLKTITQKEAQSLMSRAAELGIGKHNFNHPGNMSYFIRLKDKQQAQEIIWGSNTHQPPADTQEFYQQLEKLIVEK